MINILSLFSSSTRSLGVDIGTSSIKIVELAKKGENISLENYGEVSIEKISQKILEEGNRGDFGIYSEEIAEAIKSVLEETGIKTKDSTFAIPDFVSFFTSFDIPAMEESEIESAVQFQARQRIPLPLSEVVLDWTIVDPTNEGSKVLLLAVPNEAIDKYKKIAKDSGLRFSSLEGEIFGLSKSIGRREKGAVIAIDIGMSSTTVNVTKEGVPRMSYSLDISGKSFLESIANHFKIDYNDVRGAIEEDKEKALNSIIPLLESIIGKSKEIETEYLRGRQEKVRKILLAGGMANFPGLKEYFQKNTEIPVEIINPFEDIKYPKILNKTLLEIGPSYAVSVGMALGRFIS